MRIIKYKKISNGKYEIFLENGDKLRLYEDIILKENLLWKKEITDLEELIHKNSQYEILDVAIKRLSHHVESKKGMASYLLKRGYNENDIFNTIEKLIAMKYLNDAYYAKCYISDHINLSHDGPLKIKKHLESVEISKEIYASLLNMEDHFWKERIKTYIAKNLKANKKSLYLFKNKMMMNLINLGYDKGIIDECLNDIKLPNEDKLKEQEKEKIRLKLSRKYTGSELEYKIKEKLYQKGFFE